MKRVDLIRHLETHGAQFLREGGNHSVYVNRKSGKVSTVPRHRENQRVSCPEDLQRLRDTQTLKSEAVANSEGFAGEASDNLPDPDVLAQEIVEDLEPAHEQFREVAEGSVD